PPSGAPRQGGAQQHGGTPRGHGSRHRKPPERRSWLTARQRLAAAFILVAGVLAVGFTNGFGGDASAEPTAQAFLLDWQQQQWAQAAALTSGGVAEVRDQLAAAYSDLDATNTSLTMGRLTQHGDTAVATYTATVDLAQGGQQWSYQGQFKLTASSGKWVVDWSPSVINPRLAAGDRLAEVTTFAPRAQIEDVNGQPLVSKSAEYQIGVYPGRLKSQGATATAFASRTGLDPQQVLDQIKAAPPGAFFPLLTLDPADFSSQWPKLAKVPGLSYQRGTGTLFGSSAPEVVGQVGTEDAAVLREEGAAYQPGTTVGLTGLEQTFQDSLVGTPTTSVVLVNQAGQDVATLWKSPGGHAGTPVRTTLNGKQQAAAVSALADEPNSAEIVAIDTRTGAIRALASHNVPGSAGLPKGGTLDAKIEPGMAFSIVSAAALLSAGVDAGHALPCESAADAGGETFTYQPATSDTSTLATDFASGCDTAFASMSRTLTPQQLTSAERAFGIGASWQQLRLPAFSGSAPAVSGEAQIAAQATGTGGVLMSPLGMATIAAEVASGTGHSPVLLPTDSSATWQAPVSGSNLQELRQLMRLAVASGSAHAADLPGTPVYGQAGDVQSGQDSYLSWFVGYRGNLAVAVLETGSSASQAAAALAGTFLSAAS
ncbi:MAG TPA: penicillin-binding transpeptidase domain-containing protein, partial [Trebonia sp.]|nr:penicillin-binding transpeptidase domain-containing protein [Trebonia sp.]